LINDSRDNAVGK